MSEKIKQSLLDLIPKGDGYNSAYADTLSDAVDYIGQIESQRDDLLSAAEALISRNDFWAFAPILPGEFDDLVDAIASVRPPQEPPELFPGTLDALRDLGKQG